MRLHYLVIITIDEQELAKRNRKAAKLGIAARTADDVAEEVLSDALKHNWITNENPVVRKIK